VPGDGNRVINHSVALLDEWPFLDELSSLGSYLPLTDQEILFSSEIDVSSLGIGGGKTGEIEGTEKCIC
jgi:hypothetical protein